MKVFCDPGDSSEGDQHRPTESLPEPWADLSQAMQDAAEERTNTQCSLAPNVGPEPLYAQGGQGSDEVPARLPVAEEALAPQLSSSGSALGSSRQGLASTLALDSVVAFATWFTYASVGPIEGNLRGH